MLISRVLGHLQNLTEAYMDSGTSQIWLVENFG